MNQVNQVLMHMDFTATDDYLYTPKGYYVDVDNTQIIFDSGYSVSIITFAADFVETTQPSSKTIGELTGKSKVEGEEIVHWTFRDSYGMS